MNTKDITIRDWIAILLTFGVLAIVVIGEFNAKVVVPDRLWDIYFTVIGFFFATTPKNGQTEAGKPISAQVTPIAEVKP